MPTDGLTRYDKLSGAQIVVELRTMDRGRFPKNYETLLLEIAHRGPVSSPQLVEHEVERYDALPHQERKQFLAACLKRIGILLLQYQVLGGFAAAIAGDVVAEIARRSMGANYASVRANVTLVILVLLSVASYWAFLRWMLRERVSDMEVAIIRPRKLSPPQT